MGKKRLSDRALRGLAEDRIGRLKRFAAEEVRKGNLERSRRYNDLARRIAMRCRTSMPYGTDVCPSCLVSLVPGLTSRVRIGPGKITIRCEACGSFRRLPYLKEKRRMAKCRQEQRKM